MKEKSGRPPSQGNSDLKRGLRTLRVLRPLLPEAIGNSDILDRRRSAVIRRLLRIAKNPHRSVALAERRGITLWGDTPERFDLLFIKREPRDTWLLDESGERVVWLGGGEIIELAALSLRGDFLLRNESRPVADRRVARWRRRLRETAAEASRKPKKAGRPAGRRDARPRLIAGHDRETHARLAEQLRTVRGKFGWRGGAIFRNADVQPGYGYFDPKTRALLTRISALPTRLEVLRRIERRFRPAK